MDKKRTQQYTIKLCCLLASFILWLYIYNFVNPIKVEKFNDITVELKNTDSLSQFKLVMVPGDKYTINLTVTGTAGDLQNISKDKFKLQADLDGFGFKKGDINKIPVKIIQKPDNVQVSNSDMLFVNIRTDELSEKSIAIKPEALGKVKAGYYALPTSFNPTEVIVSGPDKMVKKVVGVIAKINVTNASLSMESNVELTPVDENGATVGAVTLNNSTADAVTVVRKIKSLSINVKTKGNLSKDYLLKSITPIQDKVDVALDEKSSNNNITSLDTTPIVLDNINGSDEQQVNLILPDGVKLISDSGIIGVRIVVDKVVQKNISLDIKIKSLGDNLNVNPDKTKVNLVLSGDESIINNIKDGDIDCYVDLNNLLETADISVPVTVKLPAGVTKLSQSPQSLKVTITKK